MGRAQYRREGVIVRGDKVCAVAALVIALGCARSKAWHKEDMPTDRSELKRDIAACRVESEQASFQPFGAFGGPTRRTVYRDCMIARGYAQGAPTDWSRPVYTAEPVAPTGGSLQADLHACEVLVRADALTDAWVSEMRGCMAAKGYRTSSPSE